MIVSLSKSGLSCRFWLGELPEIQYIAKEEIKKSFDAINPTFLTPRIVAVEMRKVIGPMTQYAALGGIYTPNNSGNLDIVITLSEAQSKIFNGTMYFQKETVFIGLSKVYLDGILAGVEETHAKAFSGELRISHAAHSTIGSSHHAFKYTASVLMKLIFHPNPWNFVEALGEEIL
jgi:hypothetical protein